MIAVRQTLISHLYLLEVTLEASMRGTYITQNATVGCSVKWLLLKKDF